MQAEAFARARAVPAARRLVPWALLCAAALSGCALIEAPAEVRRPEPAPAPVQPAPPPPPPAPVDEGPKPDVASAADLVARRLVAYDEQLLQMTPTEVAADITRLDGEVTHTSSAAAPDVVLDLALALSRQHGPGDLARASGLLEAITQVQSVDMKPWQPMARMLAAMIDEQRRLDDVVDQQAAQRRDTQRTIQQLTEKLEALKAIERSLSTRSAGALKLPAPPAAGADAGAGAPRSP
jgi:hypothetical protein